jgi:ABC-type multidrug transport system fused ATPase/permease subunit
MATAALREPLFGRVSWGAVFAGFFFGFAIWLLLLALGGGIGISAFDPRDIEHWQGLGIGFGVWGVLAGIASMFAAGWLTARLGGTESRLSGMLHGAALWGFMLVAGIWIATMAVARTAATAAQAAGGAAQAAGSAAANPQNREEMRQQGQEAKQRVQGLARQVQENASENAGKAKAAGAAGAWAFFLFGVLTLAASVLGGRAGAARWRGELPSGEALPAHGAAPAPHRA